MVKLAIFKNKKLRPWLIGGVVLVGGLVLVMMLRNKGGDASSGSYVSPGGQSEQLQMAALQVGAQNTQAQLQANVAMAQLAVEGENYRYGQDTSLAIAGLDAQTAQYMAHSQTSIQLAGIQAQENIAKAQENTAQVGIMAQANVQRAGFATQENIAMAQYGFLAEQERQETARIGLQTKAATKQSKNSMLGSLFGAVGAVAGIFSDVQKKEAIAWTGETSTRNPGGRGFDIYGRYTWTYHGDYSGGRFAGVIAQEARRVAPNAIIAGRDSRFLAVEYGALPG